ncbi:MAG: nuclear transport factor 2 family protein [Nitrososphaera sp.]|uniref:YybH family protein n=1 Tax=Nitrososphaera sp. TaxID=1971748 RepID=UPI0017EB7F3F|nr:nuclear transport factor 2 family protein [Nitrososphaera sp.]NWG37123.1 nuclear transport factor 2 family protein [Nitrososphaera sp.]
MSAADSATIQDLIYKYFQIAKSKEIEGIPDFFDDRFTKFGDSPPYDRRDLERALMLEQLQFASISDYDFKIEDLKVDVVGDAAVASFVLQSTGMIVDDYSFRGTAINNKSRVTMVFKKDKKGGWKMLHQHFSKMPG